jgi:nitric oxide reductase subunit B
VDPSRRYATLTFMRGSIVALTIALLSGALGIIYYIPGVATVMQRLGIEFAILRPMHTVFVAAFIFLGGVAVVHRYFEDIAGPMGRVERLLLRAQVLLWAVAGIGIVGSLMMGVFSGREYVGYHPAWSIPILLGWFAFAWNFYANTRRGLLHRPVFVIMWAVAVVFFAYTFLEQHAWLISGIFSDPIVDLRVQWKATGTLVGSFNLFVYGSLYYLSCKLSGDEGYARCRLAFALFGVGLLNSFTNFGHHTYHLPQSHAVKWISFVVSMTEIIILARVVWEIAAMLRARRPGPSDSVQLFVTAAKWWTAFILATALIISLPPLNALIHGTTVVMGHGMGAEIGIDAMILFAAFSWMLGEIITRRGGDPKVLASRRIRLQIIGLNVGVAALIGWLTLSGLITGRQRYQGMAPPEWLTASYPFVLAGSGIVAAYFLAALLTTWLRLLFKKMNTDIPD